MIGFLKFKFYVLIISWWIFFRHAKIVWEIFVSRHRSAVSDAAKRQKQQRKAEDDETDIAQLINDHAL